MKKFFTREARIGLTFVIAAAVLFFGLNFLKGINIFTPSNHYFAKYQNVGGLVISNPVMIKGYKVGQVRSIKYNFADENEPFLVEIAINDDVKLPLGTTFTLADDGLLGGKIIDISLGKSAEIYKTGDVVPSDISGGLMAALDDIVPKFKNILGNLDTTVNSLKVMLNSPSLQNGINSLGGTLNDLNKTMAQLKSATAALPHTMAKIDNIAANLDGKLSELDLQKIISELEAAISELNSFAQKLNNKDSSLGLLLNDKAVYNNLDQTILSANALLIDLKANPKRYINVTIFGKKEKK